MNLTLAQQQAIDARGNVLVVAGAGTGKTRTLVERCLSCLLTEKPRASLEEILMVTFTEAAAAEIRQRIRSRLEQEMARRPEDSHWPEQLALFETAHIGTLHSFCLQLVRQHFYGLDLDPQLTVLAEEEARLLAEETLDGLLQQHYAGRGPASEAVQQLVQTRGRGWDKPIRTLVLKIHHYTQTLPDPAGWFRRQATLFAANEPTVWEPWLLQALADWRARWLPVLERRAAENDLAATCAATLTALPVSPNRLEAAIALEAVKEAERECPRGTRTESIKPLKGFFDEAAFLSPLTVAAGEPDPLAEDWSWARPEMAALLELAREFTEAFSGAKRELGVVDFHDLEQHALRLLWDVAANRPTTIAQQWRDKLRFVFVDEYQDINAAQDKIIEALSREGAQANRFLVGDVKQSIYRFRLANPAIFQGYVDQWAGGSGKVIPLADNFRSREGILNVINSIFSGIMRRELGGVPYDELARLRFGGAEDRQALSAAAGTAPCVELHLRLKDAAEPEGDDSENAEALAEVSELEQAEKEARLVLMRLRELQSRQHPVWDDGAGGFRPVQWRDMAILLRAPSRKAESFAKEFSRAGVPLQVARGGFYQNLEISDLLSLLQLLDNPLQDLPLLAVLHSPLVGLTLDELAIIRRTALKTRFWTALGRWHEANGAKSDDPGGQSAPRKAGGFLERFARWRRLARQVSLSRCLQAVLAETHYGEWLLTQPRGEQREANVRRLLGLAEQFDQFQRQGLFRFLRFIEAQQLAETEPEVAAVAEENAVRLLSIHQSKGLEFPVVVVADLAKPFNLSDLNAEIILDEEYGLCPQIKPPHTGKRYPSLPYWLARRRQKRELLGEELRLLYVAMTRARDLLVLTAGVPQAKFEDSWQTPGEPTAEALAGAASYADWLRLWFAKEIGAAAATARQGDHAGVRWAIHDEAGLARVEPANAAEGDSESLDLTAPAAVWQQLEQRLNWKYAFDAATLRPAKASVSALRRRAAAMEGEESSLALGPQPASRGPRFRGSTGEPETKAGVIRPGANASAAEIGDAHHAFLEQVAIERTETIAGLKAEAQRLQEQGALRAEETGLLDFGSLAGFWGSDLGARLRTQAQFVQRELPFTARFSPAELGRVTGEPDDLSLVGEFVVVQGVVDLAVLLPREIWLVDFKTDEARPRDLPAKVKLYGPQLKLYAQALAKIYQHPVSEAWLYFLGPREAVSVELA